MYLREFTSHCLILVLFQVFLCSLKGRLYEQLTHERTFFRWFREVCDCPLWTSECQEPSMWRACLLFSVVVAFWWIRSSSVDINSESRILSDHFAISSKSGMKEINGNLVGMQVVYISWSCFPAHSAFHKVFFHKILEGFLTYPALNSEQQSFPDPEIES